jgi:hypothetical protein
VTPGIAAAETSLTVPVTVAVFCCAYSADAAISDRQHELKIARGFMNPLLRASTKKFRLL